MTTIIDNLVLAIMCKNEEKRISVSFDSVKNYINKFFIFDTGSTDNTINIIKQYCSDNNIQLFLKEGTFIDFSTSRNELLQFVDDNLKSEHFILMMDVNDEMKDMNNLSKFISSYTGVCTGFHLRQRWWCGNSLDTYFNVRMIKSHKNWRYKGVVHEYIMCPELESGLKGDFETIHKIEDVIVYQDRTLDDDKSLKRFFRDKEMLYKEFIKNPKEPRTLFYLAQTCSCLGQLQESYNYYLLRIKELGFCEEIYQSFYRLGDASVALKHDWEESFMWYMKAFQHSQRVEPLIKIVEYYKDNNLNKENKSEWHTAYMFASMACKMVWPQNQILFINRKHYTYTRWHLLGIVAYYVGRYEEGKKACITAIEAENLDIDKNNLKIYIEKELEIIHELPNKGDTLVASTILGQELRSMYEFEKKHDIKPCITEFVKNAVIKRRDQNKQIDTIKLNNFFSLNGITNLENYNVTNTTTQVSYDNIINNNQQQFLTEQIQKTKFTNRRERLKEKMINKSKLNKKK